MDANSQLQQDFEALRTRINGDYGNWSKIAETAKVSYHTLIRFANNEVKRPYGVFIRKMKSYYAAQDAAAKKAARG